MAKYNYDLFTIGAGSGGVRASRLAAAAGAKVMVAEEYRVGGTCVIRGCVPKKFMVYASEFAHHAHMAEGYGWSPSQAVFDWNAFLEAKDREIARLSAAYVTNLTKAGAELIQARARLLDAHTVDLGEHGTRTAEKILIATGGRPWRPAHLPGVEHTIVSDDAFHLPELPRRILIAGGGYIAVEFAGIFNGLGVDTTLAHRGPALLRGFDEDVRLHLAEEVARRGVKLRLGVHHVSVEKTPTGLVSHFSDGSSIESDAVMLAVGRTPYVEGLGLEAAGVHLSAKGAVAVDAYSRTNVPNIWAVGDVTNRINLTPVAIREGAAFAETEFNGRPTRFDHEMVASAVFSQPPVGSVGMTEDEARTHFGEPDVYLSRFRAMKTTFVAGEERCLIKLVVDPASQRVVGCHVLGPDSPEIIQMAAIALKMGVTKAQWDSTCAVHPTLAEELVTLRDKQAPRTPAA